MDVPTLRLQALNMGRQGYAADGRGFVFLLHFPQRGDDAVDMKYCTKGSVEYQDFSDQARLLQLVDEYDPSSAFVLLLATFDDTVFRLHVEKIMLIRFAVVGPALSA